LWAIPSQARTLGPDDEVTLKFDVTTRHNLETTNEFLVTLKAPHGKVYDKVWVIFDTKKHGSEYSWQKYEKNDASEKSELFVQCTLAGEPFEPVNLVDTIDPCNPYSWEVTGDVNLVVDIDANSVMTVTYPPGWTGSEKFLVRGTAVGKVITSYWTYTVCDAQLAVLDIPDQNEPFEPFDLDDYLDPCSNLEPEDVEWSASQPPQGWTVEIDADNVVTISAEPDAASESANITFTATAIVCCCAEASDSNDANFVKIPEVPENQPPDCSGAYAGPDCLWPPFHQMVPVKILGVTDPDGDDITITITSITSDEPTASDKGSGGAKHAPDADGVGTDTALLRAERSGKRNGRAYVISFTAVDGQGAECQASVRVNVPHDQRPLLRWPVPCQAVDDGQNYDATQMN
jgi:hypothetical protein